MAIDILTLENSWPSFRNLVENKLTDNLKVLEIGAGANPFLSKEICKKFNLHYFVQDIDRTEISKAVGSHFIVVNQPLEDISDKFDLIISHMVLEHIEEVDKFHNSVLRLLKEDGFAIHFFATLYNVASVSNKMLPGRIASWLQNKFANRDRNQHDKFKAYYRRCYGPTKLNISFYENIGYKVVDYFGFSGHNYFWKYKLLYRLEKMWSTFLVKTKNPYLCSNAIVCLKRK